jgi:hypothetical protein
MLRELIPVGLAIEYLGTDTLDGYQQSLENDSTKRNLLQSLSAVKKRPRQVLCRVDFLVQMLCIQ